MGRSLKKLTVLDYKLLKSIKFKNYNIIQDLKDKIVVKLKRRIENKVFFLLFKKNMKIDFFLLGLKFLVYNGRKFVFLVIRPSMLNYRIGEFLTTKNTGSDIHLDKKKKRSKLLTN